MKIAIIGAGICGLYLGWKLSEKGHSVTIFEKKDKIGKEVCSGLFSERILKFIPESQGLIKNQINHCLIHFPRKTISLEFSKKFFVINHDELDRLVAEFARKSGVKIILNHWISSLPEGFDRIIGADGVLSKVREILKLDQPAFYLGIQGFQKKEDFSDYVETWPTKSGFIWKIPRGHEIEYGLMEKPKEAKQIFENFLIKNKINLENKKSAMIPQSLIIPSNQKVTLCGDAAGLTKPWSGGGVIWGLIAADILLKNFPDFLNYRKNMNKKFLPKIIFSKIAKKLVYFTGFKIPGIFPKNIKIESDFLV